MFCLGQFFFVLFGFSFDAFDESLLFLDDGLFNRHAIFSLDLFDLLLYFRLGNKSFGESLEVGCEEDRVCPTCFLAPEATELVSDSVVSGLGQTRVLAFTEFVVANGNLPD